MSTPKIPRHNYKLIILIVTVLLVLSYLNDGKHENKHISHISSNTYSTNQTNNTSEEINEYTQITNGNFSSYNIPPFSQQPFITLNNNIPWFNESDKSTNAFEKYSSLDDLGRCGPAFACICYETIPTIERGEIGEIKPSGWHTIKYDVIDGKYLYNRCHLIGYQLSGENANPENLITGTRYLNIEGMLPFENMVAEYVKRTSNHVLFRATPLFEGNNLLANGVIIEAYSIEDNGEEICFNVFCYNVQPGITINYENGNSHLESLSSEETYTQISTDDVKYIININTNKFHYTYCSAIQDMNEENKKSFNGARNTLIDAGYVPCKICNP